MNVFLFLAGNFLSSTTGAVSFTVSSFLADVAFSATSSFLAGVAFFAVVEDLDEPKNALGSTFFSAGAKNLDLLLVS
ncbi:hypothetical protein BD770DRAFT_384206 [Pilaira anomala]|nr:hypothetical protein BD770DRAFT_384206 [Pilaira anomala]